MRAKVIKIQDGLEFDNGYKLYSEHESDCCEHHELTFSDLTLKDFEELEFDLSKDNFFTKIPDYGIELNPIKGWSVKIPGHGYNNGYYGINIDLVIVDSEGKKYKQYDVSECQIIEK